MLGTLKFFYNRNKTIKDLKKDISSLTNIDIDEILLLTNGISAMDEQKFSDISKNEIVTFILNENNKMI